jgi:hypothetical protein
MRALAIIGWLLFAALVPCRSALACDASNPERDRSAKTVWCVDPEVWSAHRADVEKFFPYGSRQFSRADALPELLR